MCKRWHCRCHRAVAAKRTWAQLGNVCSYVCTLNYVMVCGVWLCCVFGQVSIATQLKYSSKIHQTTWWYLYSIDTPASHWHLADTGPADKQRRTCTHLVLYHVWLQFYYHIALTLRDIMLTIRVGKYINTMNKERRFFRLVRAGAYNARRGRFTHTHTPIHQRMRVLSPVLASRRRRVHLLATVQSCAITINTHTYMCAKIKECFLWLLPHTPGTISRVANQSRTTHTWHYALTHPCTRICSGIARRNA